MRRILPVILSGGSGTRLWPLSREHYPKQFITLGRTDSLLQQTVERIRHREDFLPPLVVCHQEHRFIVAEQLRQQGVVPSAILLEPESRDTAAAIAAATSYALAHYGDGHPLLILPTDHQINDLDAFHRAVRQAADCARAGWIVTFGLHPAAPETGFGYIRQGEPVPGHPYAHAIRHFAEKPDSITAEHYLTAGDYHWNSGKLLFFPAAMQAEFLAHAPAVWHGAAEACRQGRQDLDFLRLAEEPFGSCPAISIDHGMLEHTDKAAVIPCDLGWRDIGNWQAVWQDSPKDDDGNAMHGEALFHRSRNCYASSAQPLMVMAGLENVAAIATDDAILVLDMAEAQQVKQILSTLPERHETARRQHRTVYRPWGHYHCLYRGTQVQVKKITVNPHQKISLQKHFQRSEHWVVTEGVAHVTRDGQQIQVKANESVFIPVNSLHRLENRSDAPLQLIEVQSGPYLGEDDILRVDDDYNRE